MAKVRGNDGAVYIGTAAVAEITKFDVTITPTIIQDVAIGDTWAEANAGSKNWNASIDCFSDITDTTGQGAMTAGSTVALRLFPQGNTTGKKYWYGSGIVGAVGVSTVTDTHISASFPVSGVDEIKDYWSLFTATAVGGSMVCTLNLSLPTGKVVTIDWGDNTTSTVTGPQVATAYARTYAATGAYNVAVGGDYLSLTYFRCTTAIVTGDVAHIAPLSGLIDLLLDGTGIVTYTQGTLPAWSTAAIDIRDLTLSETEVDDFLADLDDAGGVNGTLNIAGTNSAPSAAGLTSRTALIAKGWTVTVTA